jgi:hypothetical protein
VSARWRRNARLVARVALLGALGLLWAWKASPPDPRIVQADFGASILIPALIGLLSGLFGGMRGQVDSATARIVRTIGDTVVELGKKIVDGVVIVAWQFARLWDWLKKWFAIIFREAAELIGSIAKRLNRVLDRIFGPVIDFLDKVREHIWKIYNDYVKPILDIIEFIRIPLRILSQFNVEWAKRLDATLANIEDEITETFSYVMGRINYVMNALNDIVDVDRLLKRFTFIRTIMRDVRYVNQVLLMSRFKVEDAGAIDARRKRLNDTTLRDVQRNTQLVILTGDGPYGSFVREMSAQWRIELRDAGF